jgi:hypothetical protein
MRLDKIIARSRIIDLRSQTLEAALGSCSTSASRSSPT